MTMPAVASPEEWEAARARLLVTEKAATHALDALAAERRRLPMVRWRDDYVFEGPDGPVSLLDLFAGRRQLLVYQFMDNGPDDVCPGCTSMTDNTDVPLVRERLAAAETTHVTVSNMPMAQITEVWKQHGWSIPAFSSRGTTFSADCGAGQYFGLTVFLRDDDQIFRTYFTAGRGVDHLLLHYTLLDLTPLGRQEDWEEQPDATPRSIPSFTVDPPR